MAIAPFLAMTGAEMRNNSVLPDKIAWMACHFSPYGTGLSNLPKNLPAGSLLMVDDITPPHGHDPHQARPEPGRDPGSGGDEQSPAEDGL